MEFYREAKVLDVLSGVTLDMSGSTFNHHAFIFYATTNIAAQQATLYFGSLGGISPGIQVTPNGPAGSNTGDITAANLSSNIIKNRLIKINNGSSSNLKIILLN